MWWIIWEIMFWDYMGTYGFHNIFGKQVNEWMKNGNAGCILPQPETLKRQPRTRPKSPFCPDLKDGSIRGWSKWHGPKRNWGIPGKDIVSWCRLLIVLNHCLIQTACAQTTFGIWDLILGQFHNMMCWWVFVQLNSWVWAENITTPKISKHGHFNFNTFHKLTPNGQTVGCSQQVPPGKRLHNYGKSPCY